MQKKTKTEDMFTSECPYQNDYQGKDKRILFVCSAGLLRSATAARIYAGKYNTRAAGSESYALVPVSDELLLWADEVVFVNTYNHMTTSNKFDLDTFDCKVKVLDIPDDYEHMDPQLIDHFYQQYEAI